MMNPRARRTSPALSSVGLAARRIASRPWLSLPAFVGPLLLCLAGCGNGGLPTPESPPVPQPGNAVTDQAAAVAKTAPTIDVLSEPAGASIFLNGRLMGATPLKLPALEPGAYSLRLERHGCATRSLALRVNHEAQVIREELPPQPTGSLEVTVEPLGAEVLLNGELVGVTPLKLDAVPVGIHEITIRKTNYRPYTSVVRIEAGRVARFADKDKDHRLLRDLILEMLDGLAQSEPHRASHLLDKGHYLFINGRMDEAAESFLDAEEISTRPPAFPAGMTEDEREAEMRLYGEDRKRVGREVARHRGIRSFDFATTQQFNVAYEKAQQRRLTAKVDSWEWVETKGRALLAEGQYLQAVQLYQAHLDRVRDGATAFTCTVELMKVHLLLRDLSGFRVTFEKLVVMTAQDPRRLLEAIRSAQPYQERLRMSQRPEFLSIMETPLHQLLDRAEGSAKREYAAELARLFIQQGRHTDAIPFIELTIANTETNQAKGAYAAEVARLFIQQGRHTEAIPFIELAIANAETDQDKEERSLQLAETLRVAKRLDEARDLFTRLSKSERETVSKRALAGLILLGVSKP